MMIQIDEYSNISQSQEDFGLQSDNDEEPEVTNPHIGFTILNKGKRRKKVIIPEEYSSLGAPIFKCSKCNAQMWREERVNKQVTKGIPIFSMWCKKGDVKLPKSPL